MNIKVLFAFTCLVISVYSLSEELLLHKWLQFKMKHDKEYDNQEEEQMRLNIYLKNMKIIEEHNKNYEKGGETFTMRMNEFGDLTDEEYSSFLIHPNVSLDTLIPERSLLHNASSHLEWSWGEEFNWYNEGAVTKIKNQGKCGSCWAFSVVGAIESHHKIKTGNLVRLSEQQLLDCASNEIYRNMGCLGGYLPSSFQYVIDTGLSTEDSYPYTGKVGDCKFEGNAVGATCNSFMMIPPGNEMALMNAIRHKGPVSVIIDGMRPSFKFYSGGIYNDFNCKAMNHAVLAIGYSNKLFTSYYHIKNSWGPKWGEKGFFKLLRTGKNFCNIASLAIYPNV